MNLKSDVLDTYEKSSLNFIGNSNSLHELGLNSKKLEDAATEQILDTLRLDNKQVIYSSGNSESYSLILSNISDLKKIVTDNKEFYDIGLEMGKNIFYGDVSTLADSSTYMVSTKSCDCEFTGVKHIDISGNYNVSFLNKFDYITIEDDIPFFGVLIKNKNIELLPLIHGGKSTTKYRSGTASTSLIASFSKLIKLKYKK